MKKIQQPNNLMEISQSRSGNGTYKKKSTANIILHSERLNEYFLPRNRHKARASALSISI